MLRQRFAMFGKDFRSPPRLFQAEWFRTALCLALIACLTYVFLWGLWAAAPEDRAYLPDKSDLGQVFYPPRYFFARSLSAGEFALWNPHVYCGYPQFADPQAATFYPIALLLAWLAGPGYGMSTIALDIGLHFFLAGALTFLFFRLLFGSRLPALLSALAFEFGGYLTFYPPIQLSELEAAPWLPLTLMLVTLAIQRRSRLLMALAGVSLGQVFLAGRPQSYLTIGLVSLAWLVFRGHEARLPWRQIVAHLGLLGGFALGIAAVQWLPTLQLTRLSTRTILNYSYVSEGGLPFWEFGGLLTPRLLGTHSLYVGLLTLVLAGLALWRRKGLFWAGICLVCVLGSVGDHLILFDAFYLVQRLGFPGYMRNVERLAFGITFSLAALSGYGLQLLQQMNRRLLRSMLLAMGTVLTVTVGMVWLWSMTRDPGAANSLTLPLETLMFAGAMLSTGYVGVWLFRQHPPWAQVTLAAIAIVDVMSVNQGRFFVSESFPPGNDIERVAAAPPGRDAVYRITFDQTTFQDYGSLLGVDNVGGMPPLILADYARLLGILDEYRRNILLNVEVVVTTGLYTDPSFELVAQQDGFKYYRFLVPKPRAYLVQDVVQVSDAAQAAAVLGAPDFLYWDKAVVIGETGLGQGARLSDAEVAEIVGRSANSLQMRVSTQEPRLLVVADTYYPGWQASIDGVRAPIYQTNVALRGVVVPAGQHRVTLQLRPTVLYVGGCISALTCLILLAWGARAIRARPPGSRDQPQRMTF